MKVIESVKEYEDTLKENALVFVDFFADWCGPCKMLAPVVEELAAETPDVTFVKVNVDDLPEIAQKLGIMSIPALFIFKNGEAAANTAGFQPKESLKAVLDSVR
ncbi:MAG: thioredoxin [Erysipelotrichaceae bacterium]|nr:thioredoxin [Erysipelotrichaceae bacterium]